MKRDYIINTYTKGKKNFYLKNIQYAFVTSILIILFIDISIILKEGFFNFKFLLFATLGFIAFFNLTYLLFIPDKWIEIVTEYKSLKEK